MISTKPPPMKSTIPKPKPTQKKENMAMENMAYYNVNKNKFTNTKTKLKTPQEQLKEHNKLIAKLKKGRQ